MNVSVLHIFQSLNYFQQLSYFYFIFSRPRDTASVTAKRANSDLPQGATAAAVKVHVEQLETSFTSCGRKNNKIVRGHIKSGHTNSQRYLFKYENK